MKSLSLVFLLVLAWSGAGSASVESGEEEDVDVRCLQRCRAAYTHCYNSCHGLSVIPCRLGCGARKTTCLRACQAGECRCPEGEVFWISQCVPRDPNMTCTMNYLPVCGCDGQTYGNSCVAGMAGIREWSGGRCH